ncbi:unnamed protein product [Ostreobium quekettii]|uniref:Uncharacterized protein n=1 Tax=Ostreobium quekettii TaxID=121088 RepID=A0A8S1IWR3_9CHLO|nr:unnamed protein product [Ostreobium quekettii]|eukprot:evm.model.scf_1576.6 EVM.evm.TU.scf_1576.6   scf_1576:35047-36654(-)
MVPKSPALGRTCSAGLAFLSHHTACVGPSPPRWASSIGGPGSGDAREGVDVLLSSLQASRLQADARQSASYGASIEVAPSNWALIEHWRAFNSPISLSSLPPFWTPSRLGRAQTGLMNCFERPTSFRVREAGPSSPPAGPLCGGRGARRFGFFRGQAVMAAAEAKEVDPPDPTAQGQAVMATVEAKEDLDPRLRRSMAINKKITSIYKRCMFKVLKLRDFRRHDSPEGRERVGAMVSSFEELLQENREVLDSVNLMTMFHRFSIVSTLFPTSEWMCRQHGDFLGALLGLASTQLDKMETHHMGNFMLALKHLMPHLRGVEIPGATLEEVVNGVSENAVRAKDDMNLKNIAHTVAGVVCFGTVDQDKVIAELLGVVPSKLVLGKTTPQDACLLIWALGRARCKDCSSVISQLLDAISSDVGSARPGMLVDIVCGLGELEYVGADKFLHLAIPELLKGSPTLSVNQAVELIVGLAMLKHKNAEVVDLLDILRPTIQINMYQLDSAARENLTQALNALEYNPGDRFWSEILKVGDRKS